jgi:hypothetical protein
MKFDLLPMRVPHESTSSEPFKNLQNVEPNKHGKPVMENEAATKADPQALRETRHKMVCHFRL